MLKIQFMANEFIFDDANRKIFDEHEALVYSFGDRVALSKPCEIMCASVSVHVHMWKTVYLFK